MRKIKLFIGLALCAVAFFTYQSYNSSNSSSTITRNIEALSGNESDIPQINCNPKTGSKCTDTVKSADGTTYEVEYPDMEKA